MAEQAWPWYRQKPQVRQMVRYGKEATGEWYSGAAQHVAQFIWGMDVDASPSASQQMSVVRRSKNSAVDQGIEIWCEKSRAWVELDVGSWVVREADGVGVYPLTHAAKMAGYEDEALISHQREEIGLSD